MESGAKLLDYGILDWGVGQNARVYIATLPYNYFSFGP